MPCSEAQECDVYADITTRMIFLNAGDKIREHMTKQSENMTPRKENAILKTSASTETSTTQDGAICAPEPYDYGSYKCTLHETMSPTPRSSSELRFLHELAVLTREADQDSIASAMSTPTSLTPVYHLSSLPSPLMDLGNSHQVYDLPSPSSSRFKIMSASQVELAGNVDGMKQREVPARKPILLQAQMPEYNFDMSGIESCSDRNRISSWKWFDLEVFKGRNTMKHQCIDAVTWQDKYCFALSKEANLWLGRARTLIMSGLVLKYGGYFWLEGKRGNGGRLALEQQLRNRGGWGRGVEQRNRKTAESSNMFSDVQQFVELATFANCDEKSETIDLFFPGTTNGNHGCNTTNTTMTGGNGKSDFGGTMICQSTNGGFGVSSDSYGLDTVDCKLAC
ncbi:hypothetical protein GUITHDRAFT_142482 [Guillardia theta CCMP2712]|uniref:Uncharacterized protein n=1 Tax=Guillardia theta (strain CCMP2712) TaxID=905079 RepID=L1IX81_GUITC|nr:hypothetical protein GUITHDRAFT_142482 [Guillardia theta CCMP2712]EKX40868.1 hypothetical protein GUITHDRAFT_142482 [Guillardia theta CCMP2712]|eukprot:XP_005827848.1 hypothetical protein GUITHDRAFT_142482 [Guillardia theta CCMP2712]